jgi:excisionase family DNA binding protein
MVEKLLLTPIEAARALGIGRSKFYELLTTGAIESVRIGWSRIDVVRSATVSQSVPAGSVETRRPCPQLRNAQSEAGRLRSPWPLDDR